MDHDVTVVGAGPAGLCLARALADAGFSVGVVERQSGEALADPPYDGREIALTTASMRLLERLDVLPRLPADAVSPLRRAQVMNGRSPHHMMIDGMLAGTTQLGGLVSNHRIRAAAWASAQAHPNIQLRTGVGVAATGADGGRAWVRLDDGTRIDARLLVAADSRFSAIRRDRGIDADMRDFGKSMLVCRMRHEQPHRQTAWEWFDHGQTLALLPLAEHQASVVLTLPAARIRGLLEMEVAAFDAEMAHRFGHRLGAMHLQGDRHAYPLVAVYARRFAGLRLALAGDAAVGMHPVTAHGFNFGLASVHRLHNTLVEARRRGLDLADPAMLARYERQHRAGTWPLYQLTNALVGLYTDERAPARWLREGALRAGQAATPFRRALARRLAGSPGVPA